MVIYLCIIYIWCQQIPKYDYFMELAVCFGFLCLYLHSIGLISSSASRSTRIRGSMPSLKHCATLQLHSSKLLKFTNVCTAAEHFTVLTGETVYNRCLFIVTWPADGFIMGRLRAAAISNWFHCTHEENNGTHFCIMFGS